MTEEQLCNLVLEATGKSEQDLPRFRIIALGKLAIFKLAAIVSVATTNPKAADVSMAAQALRQLIRKDFNVTITNGVGDLTAAKTAAEPLMAHQLTSAEIYLDNITRRAQAAPDKTALEWDHPPGFPFYAISGDELHVRYNGTKPTTTARIRAAAVRSLANIPPLLVNDFVQIVAFMTTPQGEALLEGEAATEK